MDFQIGDRVVVTLNSDGLTVSGVVIRFSVTKTGVFYGLKVDNGVEMHGLPVTALVKE